MSMTCAFSRWVTRCQCSVVYTYMSMTCAFSRYYRTLEKQRQIDEQEQQSLLRDRERFLLCAIDNLIKCLQHHDKYDLKVFRLISLWFDNACCEKVSKYMKVCAMYCCRIYCYCCFRFFGKKKVFNVMYPLLQRIRHAHIQSGTFWCMDAVWSDSLVEDTNDSHECQQELDLASVGFIYVHWSKSYFLESFSFDISHCSRKVKLCVKLS